MENGFSNTVCTLYEIHSGEDTTHQGSPSPADDPFTHSLMHYLKQTFTATKDGSLTTLHYVSLPSHTAPFSLPSLPLPSPSLLPLLPFPAEFKGIDTWMLKRAIAVLQAKGKAELIRGVEPDDSDTGVKFFS